MEWIKEIFNYLLANYALYLVVMMGVLIMITNTILMFIKKPIKKLTGKIENAKLRKLANKMFIIFAFAFSALGWFILNKVSAYYFPFDEIKVLLTGAFSIVIYAFGDGIINDKTARVLVETVEQICEDKEVDENDKHAVADFWDKVK
jgi:dolichyl-phosphate-mannose--protein O-mannosyl transferase